MTLGGRAEGTDRRRERETRSTMATGLCPLLDVFPLPIFPESGLHGSIITTVLIGLVYMVLMNEWFGWVLSGLVVPGYLAPIFLIQPYSAVLILCEAILTHGVVKLVAGPLGRLGWRRFFGRDRFFAYLVFGTLIRALLEGYLLQPIGRSLNEQLGLALDYRNNFYSIGLIVVPLMANMFYKPGLLRGLIPVCVHIALCYATIRWVLLPFTNFSISNFELSYGYYARSFDGNAKAYIILLTSAFLASRTNLVYGWDYNGILVPSLLALAWFSPLKVITTLAEAILILHLSRWLAARRVFERVTIEAGRKLLLCFLTGYALKMALGFWIGARYPGLDATELYGFGYLLPSLIAAKMWQRDSAALILRPLLQTSIAGAVIGSLLTSALLFAFAPSGVVSAAFVSIDAERVRTIDGDLMDTLRADKARLVRRSSAKGADRAYGAEHAALRRAITRIMEAQRAGSADEQTPGLLHAAAVALQTIDYELLRLDDPRRERTYYLVRESAMSSARLHGWGLYVFDADPGTDLVLEVPRPLAEWKAIEAGAALLDRLGARALAIAGADPLAGRSLAADVLGNPASPFHDVHRLHAGFDIVAVRGEPDRDVLARGRPTDPDPAHAPASAPRLYVESRLPAHLDLDTLQRLLGTRIELRLPGSGRYERKNVQRGAARASYATLVLDPPAAQRLISHYYTGEAVNRTAALRAIDGYLLQWAQQARGHIAPSGSEAYRAPTQAELLYMDDELFTPIVRLLGARLDPQELLERLRELSRTAERIGYELVLYTYRLTGDRFLILREAADAPEHVVARRGGTFVFRLGAAQPIALEVPYPVTELHTFEAGARLLELLRAQALVVAGASRYANADLSADVCRARNPHTYFQLAHQVLVREGGGVTLTIQLRGFSSVVRPGIEAVLSCGKPIQHRAALSPRLLDLEQALRRLQIAALWYDGSRALLPFAAKSSPQRRYADTMAPGTFCVLWLSRRLRDRFRGRLAVGHLLDDLLPDLGLQRRRGNLMVLLAEVLERWRRRDLTPAHQQPQPLDPKRRARCARAIEALRRYARSANIVHLAAARDLAEASGARLLEFLDVSSARLFLVLLPPEGYPDAAFVLNVHPSLREPLELDRTAPEVDGELLRFIREGFETLSLRHPTTRAANEGGRR